MAYELPTANTQMVEEALGYIMEQFRGAPLIEVITEAFALQNQELALVFLQIKIDRTIDRATGAQLDGLGVLLDVRRLGRNDTDYRASLKTRIRINRSFGTTEEIYAVLMLLFEGQYRIQDTGFASFLVEIVSSQDSIPVNLDEFKRVVGLIRGGGEAVTVQYNKAGTENAFTTASGDVVESSTTQGTATDDAGTAGGRLVGEDRL